MSDIFPVDYPNRYRTQKDGTYRTRRVKSVPPAANLLPAYEQITDYAERKGWVRSAAPEGFVLSSEKSRVMRPFTKDDILKADREEIDKLQEGIEYLMRSEGYESLMGRGWRCQMKAQVWQYIDVEVAEEFFLEAEHFYTLGRQVYRPGCHGQKWPQHDNPPVLPPKEAKRNAEAS